MNYYITFHILAGYYAVDWFCSHINEYAIKVKEPPVADDPKKVMAIYLFWPVIIPALLLVLHWPIKNSD